MSSASPAPAAAALEALFVPLYGGRGAGAVEGLGGAVQVQRDIHAAARHGLETVG